MTLNPRKSVRSSAGIDGATGNILEFIDWISSSAQEAPEKRGGLQRICVVGKTKRGISTSSNTRYSASFSYATREVSPGKVFVRVCKYPFTQDHDDREPFNAKDYLTEQLDFISSRVRQNVPSLDSRLDYESNNRILLYLGSKKQSTEQPAKVQELLFQ